MSPAIPHFIYKSLERIVRTTMGKSETAEDNPK